MKYLTLFIICLGLTSPYVFAKKVALLISGYGNETQGKISYDLEELAQTYLVLHNHNLELDIVTPKGGKVVVKTNKDNLAYIQEFKGLALHKLQNTHSVKQASKQSYDALFIVGGDGAMFDLPFDPATQTFINQFIEQQSPIAAVCHGPAALFNLKGLDGNYFVAGKKVNSFTQIEEQAFNSELIDQFPFSLEEMLIERGATFVKNTPMMPYISVDGALITAQNPMSVAKAAEALLLKLGISPKQRTPFKDEATFELITQARSNGAAVISIELAKDKTRYDLNYLGLYAFYAHKLAQTQELKLKELNLKAEIAKFFKHPKLFESLIDAYLELQLIDEAKQAHQAFKLDFPSHKSIASIENKINSYK